MIRLKRRERSMDASALANAESWLSIIGTAKLVATFLVAIGVAIEFGGEWISIPFEKTVAQAREKQLAALRNDTVRLAADAETAKGEIARASESAAKANQIAEAERLERIKIEERIVPRTLSLNRRTELITALGRFEGQKFITFSLMGDAEGRNVAAQIADALTEAKWDHGGPSGIFQVVRSDMPVGIDIIVSSEDLDASRVPAAAIELLKILLRFGLMKDQAITKDNEPTGSHTHLNSGALAILVGTKPVER